MTRGHTDTKGALYDSSGNLIANNDDHTDSENNEEINFRIDAQLSAGQTYYIKVTETMDMFTGDFEIKVIKTSYSNTMDTAHDLSLNVWKAGAIQVEGDEMWYKYIVEKGEDLEEIKNWRF